MIRRLLPIVLVIAAWIGVEVAVPANAGAQTGTDNAAVAVNTRDGSSVFRFMFNITRAASSTVDAGNAAVAFASCTDCQTVAVAIQVVLVEGSPDTFTPENLAWAENVECNYCVTMADAYQFVIQSDTKLRLSADGERRLRAVVNELRALRTSSLDPDAMQAKIDEYADQIQDIFATELVPIGPPDDTAAASASSSSSSSSTTSTTSTTERPSTTTTSTSSTSTSTTTTAAP